MAGMNLDTNDCYEFVYGEHKITVENSELKATITLKVDGEVKAELKGMKAVTGLGNLECKLPSGEIVAATLQKIKLGDSECKVTVNGKPVELANQSHSKKDLTEGAKNAVKNTADKVKEKAEGLKNK